VALAAVLMAEFRENPRVFQAARMGRLHSPLGHFPNIAAERLNMGMDKKPKDNAFAGF
jgi:hypothetical protein